MDLFDPDVIVWRAESIEWSDPVARSGRAAPRGRTGRVRLAALRASDDARKALRAACMAMERAVAGKHNYGSAIAASLAAAGVAEIALYDHFAASAEALGERLRDHHPALVVGTGSNDPAGFDLVVNATPLGMKDDDPLPFDVARIAPQVRRRGGHEADDHAAARRRAGQGLQGPVGTDMLFELIPACLEFSGFGTATPEELRRVARLPA